jgi:hypothetical protein
MAACGATLVGLLAGGGLAATPATAAADPPTTEVATPVVSSSTTTLPLFGAQLTVDLTTGPGGTLSSVAVNPADGFTATTDKPNKVVFVDDAGTAKVVVRSRGGSQEVSAKASTLDDFVSGGGQGSWSGDVFGTGTTTTVNYTVVKLGDGSPDLTGVSTSDPTATIGAVEHEDEHDGQEAAVRIRFVSGAQSRTLTIKVAVRVGDDGASRAKVAVSLSRLKGVSLPADQLAGPHTWTGVLCSGETAQIAYTVGADGTISDVVPTPAAQQSDASGKRLDVRFSDHERVSIKVRANDDGELTISVREKIRCDAPPPSVNTPIATTTTDVDSTGRTDSDRRDHRGTSKNQDTTTTTTPPGDAAATGSAPTDVATASEQSNDRGPGRGNRGTGDGSDD